MASYSRFGVLVLAGSIAVALAGSSRSFAQGDETIGVSVNGNQISFAGTQPIEQHGSVLVPLRGVFEALGAHVDYDPDTQTIHAVGGDHHIRLVVDSSVATINGQQQQLSQPAQVVNGSTLVPLRFVAEALGDYVEWNGESHMVLIQTQTPPIVVANNDNGHHDYGQPDNNHPHNWHPDNTNVVVGVVRYVITNTRPQKIGIASNGHNEIVTVVGGAKVRRGADHDSAGPAYLGDIRRGDKIWINENDQGYAERITATYGQ